MVLVPKWPESGRFIWVKTGPEGIDPSGGGIEGMNVQSAGVQDDAIRLTREVRARPAGRWLWRLQDPGRAAAEEQRHPPAFRLAHARRKFVVVVKTTGATLKEIAAHVVAQGAKGGMARVEDLPYLTGRCIWGNRRTRWRMDMRADG